MNKQIDKFDREAEAEATAIKFNSQNTCRAPRLKKHYYCDGYQFGTGAKHRAFCPGTGKF